MHTDNPRKNVSHYAIFDYWKDKCIDKYGNVFKFTKENASRKFVDIIVDWGEPNCWGCGKIIPVEEEPDYLEWLADEEDGLKKIWTSETVRKTTERAHIVPRMLAGKDEPQNMFLLCKQCHRDSPDTSDPRMFLSWVYRTRRIGRFFRSPLYEAMKIMRDVYGITMPNFNGKKTHIGLHASGVSRSSEVYAYVSNALWNKNGLTGGTEKMFLDYLDNAINVFKAEYASHYSHNDIDKKALETLEGIKNAYQTFKTLEMDPNFKLPMPPDIFSTNTTKS